jgi:hypothetical protein
MVCFASIALADDFKTIDGKEYKNVKVSRVEPDGVVITFSGGIVKIPFTELPPEIQAKFGYNPQAAADYQKASLRSRTTQSAATRRGTTETGRKKGKVLERTFDSAARASGATIHRRIHARQCS